MTRPRFAVTFEIVTPESAEQGDAAERGPILGGATLREAVRAWRETRTAECGGVECIEADRDPRAGARWLTIRNGMEFRTGAYESRSLHFSDNLTDATRERLCRLLIDGDAWQW